MATAGPQAGQHSWPHPTARTALDTDASAYPWCSHPRAPACISGSYMPPDDTCGSQTHSRQKTLTQPCPLLAPRTALQGTRGASVLHVHTDGTQTPQSCRNAGPLSPLKQVAGPASSEERLGGGFSSPRSGVALKCSHSNRCGNRCGRRAPSPALTVQRQGRAATQQGQSSSWHLDRRQKHQVTLSPTPQGHSVPVPVCARAGRVMGQCPRSQSQGTQWSSSPGNSRFVHPESPRSHLLSGSCCHPRTSTQGHLLASLTSYLSCLWCP
ncbi:hypothetical protein mRhiFer1_009279 [Rhinolophus ferrumequinum]|uniref:Uncharacterized protein n=1 Tax=Rhinolophus ferrumequinum TaxID=59479 RepID=A0A7J7RY31_RHIFE|nr:hypothetical protein mRhiFer1_009279 [Rhinolophus ferrumequinum]